MNLAIVLVHNKGKQGNVDQINALLSLLEKQVETHDEYDEEGNPTGNTYNTYYYTIKGIEGSVKLYQIVPFGVERPENMNLIDSHNVLYGAGDEDKTGDHPRFFNWGLKRATDFGADVVVHIDDIEKIDVEDLKSSLAKASKKQSKEYGKISKKDASFLAE